MDEYKLVKKYFDNNSNTSNNRKKKLYSSLNKILISVLLLVICLCVFKMNSNFKDYVYKNVYNTNISFAKINDIYKKLFGDIYPIDTVIKDYTNEDTELVFSEKIVYKEKEKYNDGVKLKVGKNYLIPVQDSGIIVYEGNKDDYGYTIIIQQVNGIDLWYVGIENSNYKLYDYVEKGSLLGESSDEEIYLYYQKNGKFINYEEYFG